MGHNISNATLMTRLDREKVAQLAKFFKEEAAELAEVKG